MQILLKKMSIWISAILCLMALPHKKGSRLTFRQAHDLVYTDKCRTTTNLFGKRAKQSLLTHRFQSRTASFRTSSQLLCHVINYITVWPLWVCGGSLRKCRRWKSSGRRWGPSSGLPLGAEGSAQQWTEASQFALIHCSWWHTAPGPAHREAQERGLMEKTSKLLIWSVRVTSCGVMSQ